MSKFFIVLSVLLMAGCSSSFDIQLTPEVNVIVSTDRDNEITLTSENEEYVMLNDWLREHQSGWLNTSGKYPGGVYVQSGEYGIQVSPMHVVIYITVGLETKAIYIQHIGPEDLVAVKNIGH